MAVTLVQGNPVQSSGFSGTTGPALAYTSAVTSGNLLVGQYTADSGSTVTSVADSVNAGNWTQAAVKLGASANAYQYYKVPTGAGTPTVTFTVNNSTNGCEITLFEASGASQLALDLSNNNSGTTGVSNAGNLNTTKANAILIASTENLNAESTAGTSFTFLNSTNGFSFAGAQYRIVSATSNYATAFATDTAGSWSAVAAAYGEAAASGFIPLIGEGGLGGMCLAGNGGLAG